MTRPTNIFQFLIIFVSSPFILSQDYRVIDFGAIGNGIANDTRAVRAALAAAANKTNGGRVIFDVNHTFLTGCFNVSSNIILDIQGKILTSNLTSDYVPVQPLPWYGGGPDAQLSGQMEWQSVIRSYQADNITITGGGVIDGQGQYWWPCQLNLTQPPCSGLSR
jgi:polygalacturonase